MIKSIARMKNKLLFLFLMLISHMDIIYGNVISSTSIPFTGANIIEKDNADLSNKAMAGNISLCRSFDNNLSFFTPINKEKVISNSNWFPIDNKSIFGDYSIRLAAVNFPQVREIADIASYFGALGDYIILVYSFLAYSENIKMTFNTIKSIELFVNKSRRLSVFFEYSDAIDKRNALLPQYLNESPSDSKILDILIGVKYYIG